MINVEWNVCNKIANMALFPVAIAAGVYFIPDLGFDLDPVKFLIFSVVYIYASWFFSPDLDHEENRPGKHTFPLPWKTRTLLREGIHLFCLMLKPIGLYRLVNPLKAVIFAPLNLLKTIWWYFWMPYAELLTHRGVSHIPVFGTLTRLVYLLTPYFLYLFLFEGKVFSYGEIREEIMNLVPYLGNPSKEMMVILVPIYLADIFHSLVDGLEAMIKGHRFCSKRNKRGLLARVLNPIWRN